MADKRRAPTRCVTRRDVQTTVRSKLHERHTWERAATASDQTLSEFVRDALNRASRQSLRKSEQSRP